MLIAISWVGLEKRFSIHQGGALAGRIQPGIPLDPSYGDLVVWEKRFLSLRKVRNLLRQARPHPQSKDLPWANPFHPAGRE